MWSGSQLRSEVISTWAHSSAPPVWNVELIKDWFSFLTQQNWVSHWSETNHRYAAVSSMILMQVTDTLSKAAHGCCQKTNYTSEVCLFLIWYETETETSGTVESAVHCTIKGILKWNLSGGKVRLFFITLGPTLHLLWLKSRLFFFFFFYFKEDMWTVPKHFLWCK